MPLDNVKHILLVLSGKGGVGKSSVTTQLALTLSLQGHTVGVLDVDLTGPSIPRFFGVENSKITQAPGGWVPVTVHQAHQTPSYEQTSDLQSQSDLAQDAAQPTTSRKRKRQVGGLYCMSLGFVLSTRNSAVIWRGPKKTAMVRQFLSEVAWPPLDYLLIDTPPGTSDEHISLLETLMQQTSISPPAANETATGRQLPHLAGALLVTTPQAISTADVRKELSFCKKTGVRPRGILENMSGFVCPHCAECAHVFGKGGGEVMARDYDVPFLGGIPLDPAFGALIEEGKLPEYPKGTVIEGVGAGRVGIEGDESQEVDGGDLGLAEKYLHCALFPKFDGIVKKVVQEIESEGL